MSGKANKNQGVRIIADFEDRAIPLNTPAGVGGSGKASRSANEGIRLLADFENDVRPLNAAGQAAESQLAAEPWSKEFADRVREWCDKVAGLGVDALVDAGLVPRDEFERVSGIVTEELFVRLCLHDYPPVPKSLGKAPDA